MGAALALRFAAMSVARLSSVGRWRYAVKLASWPKVLVPALLGQGMGVASAPFPSLPGFAVGLAFTALDIVFIVLLNDWGDEAVDAGKRRMFPDAGSPKTIPDGILPAGALLRVGLAAAAAALLVAFVGERFLPRPGLTGFGALCLGFFVAYTLPPVRLNYRGGGELLEGLGVGVLLPWFNAYVQSGRSSVPALGLSVGFTAFAFASALASGLSDEQSDRAGGKRTVVTAFGNAFARRAVESLLALGTLVLVVTPFLAPAVCAPWVPVVPALLVIHHGRRLRAASAAATTNAFRAQTVYKGHLHAAIWQGALALSLGLCIQRALGGPS
jgi:1,4-dihydroxy-2-naphthoate octaprenyltransferase